MKALGNPWSFTVFDSPESKYQNIGKSVYSDFWSLGKEDPENVLNGKFRSYHTYIVCDEGGRKSVSHFYVFHSSTYNFSEKKKRKKETN